MTTDRPLSRPRSAPRRDTITLLGQDLAGDLMGKVGFGELALWLVTQRRPTPPRSGSSRRCSSRWPTTASRRPRSPPGSPTCSAPDSRAGRARRRPARRRLAVPRRHRGHRPVPGRGAGRGRPSRSRPTTPGYDALALAAVQRGPGGGEVRARPRPSGAQGQRPAHPGADRRSPRRRGCAARTCGCSRRSAGSTPQVLGRTLPLNGAGICGAALADLGLPPEPAARLRAAGPHRRAARPARRGAAPPDRQRHLPDRRPQRRYLPPDPLVRRGPPSPSVTSRGSRHGDRRRGHRLDPSPVLLPREHLDRRRTGRRSPTSGSPRSQAFRETLTRANPDVLVHGGQRPLPPALAGQHAAVPRRQGAVLRRELVQRGARVRPAADVLHGHEDLSAHILRGGLDAGFDLAFSNELRIDHSITCPMITLRPAGRPADRADLHEHLRAAAAAAQAVRRSSARRSAQLVESWPSDQRVAIIGTGHLSLELGGPRQFGPHGPDPEFDRKAVEWIATGDIEEGARRGDRSRACGAGQRHARLHGLHADDGRRRGRA